MLPVLRCFRVKGSDNGVMTPIHVYKGPAGALTDAVLRKIQQDT